MGLATMGHLDPMLELAEKNIGLGEVGVFLIRQITALGNPMQGAQRMALLQPAILPAEHELKTLSHKLDLTNPAAAELDVDAAAALLFEAAIDLLFDLFDLLQRCRI